MDRLSNLPDGIIIHILSSLSTDEAASTSILSKRWRNLFAFTPNLHFAAKRSGSKQNFIDFVDRVLAVSGNSPITSFTLECQRVHDSVHTKRWICNVLSRGVLHLDLDLTFPEQLPLEMFACKTLVKVKVRLGIDIEIPMLAENVSLPALRTLSFTSVLFCDGFFEKLISVCPLLEEFTIDGIEWEFWKYSRILSSPKLKRLIIKCYDDDELGSMTFDYPNLVYLEYTDYVQYQYPVVNLASLVEAKINMERRRYDDCDPTNLIKGLRNVKILKLESPKTLDIFGDFHEAIPVFENLTHLSITSDEYDCYSDSSLLCLLKKSPNLQTLVFEGPWIDNYPPTFCENFTGCYFPLKVLQVTVYKGSIQELEKLKRFLEAFSCLELVNVCASAETDRDKLRLTTDLLLLPRASSKCKIQVEFY